MIKVLVVEDEHFICQGIIAMLRRGIQTKIEYFEACDGVEGLAIYNDKAVDIIITDIRMPNCDGLELVEKIVSQTKNPPIFIILSGYSDFEYAKQAIKMGVNDYLTKPINKTELIETVTGYIREAETAQVRRKDVLRKNIRFKEANQSIRESKLQSILKESFSKDFSESAKQLAQWNIETNASRYICVLGDYRRKQNEKDDEWQKFSIVNVCKEVCKEILTKSEVFLDNEGRITILIPGEDELQLNLLAQKIAQKCWGTLRAYLKQESFFGIGSVEKTLCGFFQSYNKAKKMLKFKVFDFEKGYTTALKPTKTVLPVFVDWFKIGKILITQNPSAAIEPIEKLLKLEPSIDLLERLENEYNTMSYVLKTMIPINHEDLFLQNFERNWSISELRVEILKYMERVKVFCDFAKTTAPRQAVISSIMRFIQENLANDITLNSLAEHFGYNPSYVSALFKKETNKNVSEYIQDLRIKRAKKLLSDTSMTMQQISAQIGYLNSRYFGVVFKRKTGVTPAVYRNMVIK